MLNPRFKNERSYAVSNDNRVVVLSRNRKNELIAIVPGRQILPVAGIAIYSDVSLLKDQQRTGEAYRVSHLPGVGVHEYDGNLLTNDCTCCRL